MGPVAVLAAVSSAAWLAFCVLALLAGAGIWEVIGRLLGSARREAAQKQAEQVIEEAQRKAEELVKTARVDAKAEFLENKEKLERLAAEQREEFKQIETRLAKREDNLESKLDTLTTKERSLEQTQKQLTARSSRLEEKEQHIEAVLQEQRDVLLRITNLNPEEARELLFKRLEHEYEHEAAVLLEKTLETAKDEAQNRARDITITAIQRFAAEHTSASTVSTIDIPSDEIKGRVIGREGRNIRAFEKATGVDVIVDDTPGVVVVSAFDPVRREVARRSLVALIQDGRIHPTRIEEIVKQVQDDMDAELFEIGKKAGIEANVRGLHRKQLELLGRLHFRTSYGQNVLRHSIEVAYLCQVMADELGLDGALARRCGLLHDIGKAVDHEVEGGHPQIGADICKRFNEVPEVLNAIAGHHGDIDSTSPYTPMVAAADAISAVRPGARRESLERYIQRLEALEGIATSFDGVRQAYAVQAGREVRVIVDAARIDDAMSVKLARDIAKRIEEEMTYPGEVRVTVLREVRAVDYAR